MVKGIETSLRKCENGHDLCDVCVRGKQNKESYPATTHRATRRLELLHLDMVGELLVEGANEERYFLTLLDDFTRACEVRALVTKSQVTNAVKEIILLWENQTRHTVQVVRTDWGSEFLNADMHDFFASKGIRHEMYAPHTPEQNGRAERLPVCKGKDSSFAVSSSSTCKYVGRCLAYCC
jgi:transposase InsO family protein